MPGPVQRARALRRTMSLPEVLLWQALRRGQAGLRVRRQHPMGCYVLDFWCAAARVAIEVDGFVHETRDRALLDAERDRWLAGQGITVQRIAVRDVLADPVGVAQAIADLCRAQAPPSALRAATSPLHGEDI